MGLKANSSVRKFPEMHREISGVQVLLRWSRVSMEAGCMLPLGGGVSWARTLGPGGQTRLAEAGVVCFLRKSRGGSKRRKRRKTSCFSVFSGRLARVRAGVYLDLS